MAVPPLLLLGALAALLAAPSTARLVCTNASAAPSVVEVRVGVLLPGRNLRYHWAWPRVGPALSLALEALEPQLRHAGLALRTAFASTEDEDGACDSEVALFKATELVSSHGPDVLFGLGCSHVGKELASSARHWRLPLLRAGLYEWRSRDPASTTVYGGPGGPDYGAAGNQLLRHFNWTCFPLFVVSPEIDGRYDAALFSLLFFGEHPGVTGIPTIPIHHYEEPGDEAVRFIQANGRVVYILGSPEMLQKIMRLAQAQNMTSGDYVFIYVDFFGESLRAEGHREAAKPWQSKEKQDVGGLREAFQMVLVFTSHGLQPPQYWHFQSQVILRAQRDFGVALNDSMHTSLVAGCFHDVLLLYLRALNETLREGGTKRDTSRILEKMRGLKIQGVTGTVSINSDNDREMDFDLWAMRDVVSGEYQVVAQYVGSEKQIRWTGPIHWKKGNPLCDIDMHYSSSDEGAVGSTLRRQEAEKYGFVTT